MHPAMIDIAATARRRAVRTPSAGELRRGLTTARLGRWRTYAEQLTSVLPLVDPWLDRLGYR